VNTCGEAISLRPLKAAEAIPARTPLTFRWSQEHADSSTPLQHEQTTAHKGESTSPLAIPALPTSPGLFPPRHWKLRRMRQELCPPAGMVMGGWGSRRSRGSREPPLSGRGSRRAELSASYHQPMGELVALAVLPHGFVIFFGVSGVPQEMRLPYNW